MNEAEAKQWVIANFGPAIDAYCKRKVDLSIAWLASNNKRLREESILSQQNEEAARVGEQQNCWEDGK